MQSKLLHEQNVMSVLSSMSFKDHGNWMKQAKLLLIFSYLLNMSYERNIILERMQYILLLITLEKYDIYCTVECLDIYSKIQTKTSLNCIKFHLHIFKDHFTLMQCSSLLSKLLPLVRNGFAQFRYFVYCKTTY